jgi:hypothetical protein
MQEGELEIKTVFISYCHKDTTEEWIIKLVTKLGEHGINCVVDIYDLKLGQDLNYFMEQIEKVDKVLILLGKTYKEKADSREGGVGAETQIISNDVYKDVKQTKFIPAVIEKDENGEAYLPYYLKSRLYVDFSNDELFNENFSKVIKQIKELPIKSKPEILKKNKYSWFPILFSLTVLTIMGVSNLKIIKFLTDGYKYLVPSSRSLLYGMLQGINTSSFFEEDDKRDIENNSEFINQYVFGEYKSLIMEENITTVSQPTDVSFYISEDEQKKGNYIRVLQYWMDYDFSDIQMDQMDYFLDMYESILISLCERYNNVEMKLGNKSSSDCWEFLDDKGVFINIPCCSRNLDYRNTLVYEYSDGVIIEKCLYFGEDYIIVVIWSSSEQSYEDMFNTKKFNILSNCFNSFKQIYKN